MSVIDAVGQLMRVAAGGGGGGGTPYPLTDSIYLVYNGTLTKYDMLTGATLQSGVLPFVATDSQAIYDSLRDRLFVTTTDGPALHEIDTNDYTVSLKSWGLDATSVAGRISLSPDGKVWIPEEIGSHIIDIVDTVNDTHVSTTHPASWANQGCRTIQAIPDGTAWAMPRNPSNAARAKLAKYDGDGTLLMEAQLAHIGSNSMLAPHGPGTLVSAITGNITIHDVVDGSAIDETSIPWSYVDYNCAVDDAGNMWFSGNSRGIVLINDAPALDDRTRSVASSTTDDSRPMLGSDGFMYHLFQNGTLYRASLSGTTIVTTSLGVGYLTNRDSWEVDPSAFDIYRLTNPLS